MKDRWKECLWNGWKGSFDEGQKEGRFMEWMEGIDPGRDRRKQGLWNGWKGSIDEGQKEGRFMEWMEGIDR